MKINKNLVASVIKNNLSSLAFPIFGLLLRNLLSISPVSLYFWNPTLEFLFNFFIIPFKWFPDNFYFFRWFYSGSELPGHPIGIY